MERTGFEQWKPREVARLLALVETERRYYQDMVAALPVALAVLTPDRAIVSSNRAFRQLVGLSGEELRQKSIEQVLPSDQLIERIRAAHVHGDAAPFLIDMGERRFRVAAVPIRSWEEEMESETLLMVEPMEAEAPPPEPPAVEAGATKAESPVIEATPAEPVEVPAVEAEPATVEAETAGIAGPASEAVVEPAPAEPVEAEGPVVEAAPAFELSSVPAVIWQADADTFAFTYVGGAAEELLGYPAAHWLAEPLFFSERIHPEDRAEVMALYQAAAAAGGETSAEYRAVSASGEAVWRRETIRVPTPGAGPRLISGVLTAIAERRQLEAQALEAGRIDALRGLASRLAHDLNNPLMIVTGYGEELLNAFSADDTLRGDVTELMAATARMTELAGSLLSFTRPQAKPTSMTSLSEVVSGLEPDLREIVDVVEIDFPRGAVWTFADAEQLEEAIAALATFAIGNTDEVSKLTVTGHTGRVSEWIGTASLPPGAYARLDLLAVGRGSGTAQGVFESILPGRDPLKTAGAAVTRAYLNVRQWGGDIVFSDDAALGSSFTVYLPYAEPPYSEPAVEPVPSEPEHIETAVAESEAAPVEEAPAPEPSPGTILVVEDEPGIRGLVRKILRRERYEVLEAGSGEEALAAASVQGSGIDLLLTDVILPGIGGRELAEFLKASHPDLQVVYVSGFTDDEGVRAGQFPPGSKFLQKPFTLSALVGVVKEALES